MPLKRGKFSARFPAGRIKKIMQLDKDVGKVSATVPPVVSRALELFVENLMSESFQLAQKNNLTKTISVSHLKHVIERDQKFSFARKLVRSMPELQIKALHAHTVPPAADADASASASAASASAGGGPGLSFQQPKRRGRKPKRPLGGGDDDGAATTAAAAAASSSSGGIEEPRKKRKYTRRAPTAAALAAAAAAAAAAEAAAAAKSLTSKTGDDDDDGDDEDDDDDIDEGADEAGEGEDEDNEEDEDEDD